MSRRWVDTKIDVSPLNGDGFLLYYRTPGAYLQALLSLAEFWSPA